MLREMYRLKKQGDFDFVYEAKQSQANKYFICYFKKNEKLVPRFGFSISKKVGKAHERNLIRRRLGEIIRLELEYFKEGYDIIIIARKDVVGLSYLELKENFNKLMKKCQLLEE